MPLEQRGPAPEDFMKKVRVLILFLFTGLLLTSCLREAVPPLTEEASGETENAAPEQLPEEVSPSGEEAEAAPAGETEEASEKSPAEEVPAWAGMTFLLEDASLTLPFSFADLGDDWSIDPESNVLPADTVLAPGERTMGNVPIISESWDEMLVTAGFVNLSGEALPLEKCSLWSITMDATWAGEEDRPSLSLPGDLTWGESAEDVKKAYGDPSVEPFYSESMSYSSYTYDWKFVRDMELVVYDEDGLTMFTLSSLDAPE